MLCMATIVQFSLLTFFITYHLVNFQIFLTEGEILPKSWFCWDSCSLLRTLGCRAHFTGLMLVEIIKLYSFIYGGDNICTSFLGSWYSRWTAGSPIVWQGGCQQSWRKIWKNTKIQRQRKIAKILSIKKLKFGSQLILLFSNSDGQRHNWLPLWPTSAAAGSPW